MLGLLLGEGRVRCLCWDVLTFAVAAVLVCGFSAGVSAAGVARWYMTAGMLAGAIAWHSTVRPIVHHIVSLLLRLFLRPLYFLEKYYLEPLRCRMHHRHVCHVEKKAEKSPKTEKSSCKSRRKYYIINHT